MQNRIKQRHRKDIYNYIKKKMNKDQWSMHSKFVQCTENAFKIMSNQGNV